MSDRSHTSVWPYFILMRPANLVTAVADVAAGFAVGAMLSGEPAIWPALEKYPSDLLLLCVATIGLYGGGVVFNDIFDLPIDRVERPERPLPSGAISLGQARILGTALLGIGVAAALFVNLLSGVLAVLIALLALVYDKKGKHHPVLGPLNMALCRGGNLLLGVSAFSEVVPTASVLMVLPVIYIGSITLISRGEVAGGDRKHLNLAVIGYTAVILLLLNLGFLFPYGALNTLPFVMIFAALVYPPLLRARRSLDAGDIRKAVKAGVITLILLDAALAAGFTDMIYGLVIAGLLPVSLWLGRIFAVT